MDNNCLVEMISLPPPPSASQDSSSESDSKDGEEESPPTRLKRSSSSNKGPTIAGDKKMRIDQMRLSFLEEESKYSRAKLNSTNKQVLFLQAQINILVDWIQSNHDDVQLINKESMIYKKWHQQQQKQEEQLKFITKSLTGSWKNECDKKSMISSHITNRAYYNSDNKINRIPPVFKDTTDKKKLPLRSCKERIRSYRATNWLSDDEEENEEDEQMIFRRQNYDQDEDWEAEEGSLINNAAAANNPPKQFGLIEPLQVEIKQESSMDDYLDLEYSPNSSNTNMLFEEEDAEADQDQDQQRENYLMLQSLIHLLPPEDQEELQQAQELQDFEDQCNDQQQPREPGGKFKSSLVWRFFNTERGPKSRQIISNTCKLCGKSVSPKSAKASRLYIHLRRACVNPQKRKYPIRQSSSSRTLDPIDGLEIFVRSEAKDSEWWPQFVTKRDPITRKILKNNCKHCGGHVSPKLSRLKEHLAKCPTLNPSSEPPAPVEVQAEAGTIPMARARQLNVINPILGVVVPSETIAAGVVAERSFGQMGKAKSLFWTYFTTIKDPETKRVVSNTCKACGETVQPRAYNLRAHLRICSLPESELVKKPQGKNKSQIYAGRFEKKTELWVHFKWKKKEAPSDEAQNLVNEEPLEIDDADKAKSVRSMKLQHYDLHCKYCHKSVSPVCKRLRSHLRRCKNFAAAQHEPNSFNLAEGISNNQSESTATKQCDECGKILKGSLAKHIRSVHLKQSSGNFRCLQCPSSFGTSYHLQRHRLSCHGQKGNRSSRKNVKKHHLHHHKTTDNSASLSSSGSSIEQQQQEQLPIPIPIPIFPSSQIPSSSLIPHPSYHHQGQQVQQSANANYL